MGEQETRRIGFVAVYRDDGTMFVTSRQLPLFSVVAKQGHWSTVFELARNYCALNFERRDMEAGRG